MLRLSATLYNRPVMSLRSGGQIAEAIEPIINPHNLKIMGWWCKEPAEKGPKVLLAEDVRQIDDQGLAINDESELCDPKELVRHKEVLDLNFQLMGKTVKTKQSKLGKVEDFSYADGMFVQKLYVSRPLTKILSNDDTLLVDRTQIIEVTDHFILVRDAEVVAGAKEVVAVPAVPAV